VKDRPWKASLAPGDAAKGPARFGKNGDLPGRVVTFHVNDDAVSRADARRGLLVRAQPDPRDPPA